MNPILGPENGPAFWNSIKCFLGSVPILGPSGDPSFVYSSVSGVPNYCAQPCGSHIPFFVAHRLSCAFSQVQAVWQWYNYLTAAVPAGKRVLRLNLDETSLCLHQARPQGIICLDRKRCRSLAQPVPHAKRRRYMSYISIICDSETIQRILPQFLIGNAATLKHSDMPEFVSKLSPNVRLWRRKSAWVNERAMLDILRHLHAALLPFLGDHQPILMFDAAPPHTTPLVFRLARRLQIWPLTIPAKSTWLVQPLDTHGFLRFKRNLQQLHLVAQISSVDGEAKLVDFLQCVCAAIGEEIAHRSWGHAFERNGFGELQAGISERIRAELGLDGSAACASECPTLEQVAYCFPKRFPLTPEIAFGPIGRVAVGAPLLLRAAIPGASRPPQIVRKRPVGRMVARHVNDSKMCLVRICFVGMSGGVETTSATLRRSQQNGCGSACCTSLFSCYGAKRRSL